MPINVGDQFAGTYRALRRLGEGGWGEVYLAEDELLGRQVAIKLLHDRDAEDQTDLVHEMMSLDQLHHPGVVTFYHHFAIERTLFLVMEYCEGGSLRDHMRLQPARVETVMQWVLDLTDTLHYVHQRGIVHHDIKPDNILFASDGALKIGDFGVANRNIGTVRYLAPEMLLGSVDAKDARIDVYALGVTLLELLLNRNPFEGMSQNETLVAKLRHDFIPTDLARWVQELVSKATHPTPELRFQSMKEFREAIESKHVSYVFERSRIQAHTLAAKAEKLLSQKRVTAAAKCITQALYVCPDCVSAVIAAGRYNLFINRISEAKQQFDKALLLNPRANIQKELGWLCLEDGNYSQAISLLTDYLQRNAADGEAFNLLLECFYRTERYEIGTEVAKLMIEEGTKSSCFADNGFLCGVLQISSDRDKVLAAVGKPKTPFLEYNMDILKNAPLDRLKSLLLFENYRFGLTARRQNVIAIENGGRIREFKEQIVTIGRSEENLFRLSDNSVSRRHCVVVNFSDDVWVYDLDSTQGVVVDGTRVDRKAYLEGLCTLKICATAVKIRSKLGLLL